MAVIRTRTAGVFILSTLVVGIFVVTVLPRWRRTANSTVSGLNRASEQRQTVDVWKPRDRVANMKASYSEPPESIKEEPGGIYAGGQSERLRSDGPESDINVQEEPLDHRVSELLSAKQLAVLMHQKQGPVMHRKQGVTVPWRNTTLVNHVRNREPWHQLIKMSDDGDSLLKVVAEEFDGRQPGDLGEKQRHSPRPAPPAKLERPHRLPAMPPGTKEINEESWPPLRHDSSISGASKVHYEPKKPPSLALSTTVTMATSHVAVPVSLPFITRGSLKISPERLPPPAHSSKIYFSLLTAPIYHNLRFSLQYLTWLQTVDPKQVGVVTDSDDNEWIQALKKEGGHIYLPSCPLSTSKTREMMCCKTGAQFDYWYRARENGMQYKWYCHFDDDLYVNPQALVDLLSTYDPSTDRYIGAWKVVARARKRNRVPGYELAKKLIDYAERKRDDFRYANGPSYCISEALMMKVEKYLRGRKYEKYCEKFDVPMDDILPGVIIDAVLGIDMNVTDEFKSQMDFIFSGSSKKLKGQAQKYISVGFGRFHINDAKFTSSEDPNGIMVSPLGTHEIFQTNHKHLSPVYLDD